jgi:PTH1 family peptidyl-tRNA hydrolase
MKIIIGLGNPGTEYQNTRHNTGVMLVDRIYKTKFMNYEYGFRRKKDIYVYESDDLVLVKTASIFMNESGRIIREVLGNRSWELGDLYLAHDDLDIKLGEYKIQLGVGPKEHNGLKSVEQALGTDKFWRVRIGIDNRDQKIRAGMGGEDYVLQKFFPEEKEIINETVDRAITEIFQK